MDAVSAFFMQNIIFVYFFYGLAFFAMGLVVLLESGRATEFRFGRALLPLALFGFIHAGHEWYEMFQVLAAHEAGYTAGPVEEAIRVAVLAASFLCLLWSGTRLLPDAEIRPYASPTLVGLFALLWLGAVGALYLRFRSSVGQLVVDADVLARYSLAIPGSILAAWALLRERHDFHARGMSQYGQGLLWAALAFLVYGVIGQMFTRPSQVFPSQTINTAFFLRAFGIPVQLVRGLAAAVIAFTLAGALRAFEQESRIRLATANKDRIEAQAAALEAQQRRADEVEALNVQLRATARELSAMVEMSRILASTVDLIRLLRDALYQIVHSIEGAGCGVILLRQAGDHLDIAGEYRRPDVPLATILSPIPAAVQAAEAGRSCGTGPDDVVQVVSEGVLSEGATYETLGVPLRAKGQLFGALGLAWSGEGTALAQKELSLLNAFSQQVAASLENAQLYRVLQEREGQLADLVRQLVNAQEGERQRIARELHDETGQKLTALAMGLAAVEAQLGVTQKEQARALVQNLRSVADQAMVELRNVMANLRPSQLDDLGLVPALRWYLREYEARQPNLDTRLVAERMVGRLPPSTETVLFRVAQEALTNVTRHARASMVTVTLDHLGNTVSMEVCDDGIGFDPSLPVTRDQSGGWGIVGMRERVVLAGGKFNVDSQPGRGTRIRIELPLDGGEDEVTAPGGGTGGGS